MRDLALALLAVVGAGCGAFRPAAVEVAPGQRVVLGRVDLAEFEAPRAAIDILKDDGTFGYELTTGPGGGEFAIALPPGRYRMLRIRGMKDGADRASPNETFWALRAGFEVGPEPAVYIGTLRLGSTFGRAPRVSVVDEYDDTVRVLRRLYRDLPPSIVRRLASLA